MRLKYLASRDPLECLEIGLISSVQSGDGMIDNKNYVKSSNTLAVHRIK